MPVTSQDVAAVKSVSLPAVRNVYERIGPVLIEQVAVPATDTTCIASVLILLAAPSVGFQPSSDQQEILC